MKEIVQPRNADAVELGPCPAWCMLSEHFPQDAIIDADDGFHHYGPKIAVPTSDRMFTHGPESMVNVSLRAWTKPLDAGPDPGRIGLELENADTYVELTPGEARAVAAALLEFAQIAEADTG